jgi:hypothetical protein
MIAVRSEGYFSGRGLVVKYLLFIFLFTLFFSGCATGLRGITEEVRIPFVSDRTGKDSQVNEKSRSDKPVQPTQPASPNPAHHFSPTQVSVREAAFIDQF